MTKKNNIALIGMPGCGKTTIAKAVSALTGLTFYDIDEKIAETENRTISEIFAENGEEHFRELETKAVIEAAKMTGMLISTGGGIVLREENMSALRGSSYIIYISRGCDKILQSANNSQRPLLCGRDEKIFRLYEERASLYEKYSDIIIPNDDNIEAAIKAVTEVVYEQRKKNSDN